MAPKSILFFGSTGYVGGSFLSQLHYKYGQALQQHYRVTLASRNIEKANKIKSIIPGLETVPLDLRNTQAVEHEAARHEIIIYLADSDSLDTTQAILKGMKLRKEQTGVTSVLYHTSGALFLCDFVKGHATETTFSDLESDRINAIPLDKPHRLIDDAIVRADEAGHVRAHIIVPAAIYGTPTGIVHEHGLANPLSAPVQSLVHVAVQRKAVGQIGPGENWLPVGHVDDVASLVLVLLEGTDLSHGKEGWYFAIHGSVQVKGPLKAMAMSLHSMGLSESDSPTPFTEDELNCFPVRYWGWSVICHSDKSRAAGWKPLHREDEFEQFVADETKRLTRMPLESYGLLNENLVEGMNKQ